MDFVLPDIGEVTRGPTRIDCALRKPTDRSSTGGFELLNYLMTTVLIVAK